MPVLERLKDAYIKRLEKVRCMYRKSIRHDILLLTKSVLNKIGSGNQENEMIELIAVL